MSKKQFLKKLLQWHDDNPRKMPWSGIKDPYRIWISEVILQQTRVAQGWDYYLSFIDKFPDVFSLASANEDEVLKAWEGLGYYSRARNILKTGKIIVDKHQGVFPSNYDEIIALPGIGPYTAAAVGSFAFGLNKPVLDGNVMRVITRYTGNDSDILNGKTKKEIEAYLEDIIVEGKNPAIFNQAIMNFGALQCTISSPDCAACPMKNYCVAYKENIVEFLPVKLKKIKKKKRYLNFVDLRDKEGNFLIHRRNKKDIWEGLYEFLLFETKTEIEVGLQKIEREIAAFGIKFKGKLSLENQSDYKHQLTHQTIYGKIFTVRCNEIRHAGDKMLITNSLSEYAFPKLLDLYLQDNL